MRYEEISTEKMCDARDNCA